MDTRTKETIRYLGYGKHAVDDQTLALIGDSFRELEGVADQRIIYRIFHVSLQEPDQIHVGKLHITSRNLAKNLRDCSEVILFGATLGIGVDLLIRRTSLRDMSRAVVLQAAAATMLEESLDVWVGKLASDFERQGKYLRPRFSPGYGDFDIRHQQMILRMLEAEKRIGLTVTDSFMLTPAKSVTAVMGISDRKLSCTVQGCETCTLRECAYRRRPTMKSQP